MTTTIKGVLVQEVVNGVTKNVVVPLPAFGAMIGPFIADDDSAPPVVTPPPVTPPPVVIPPPVGIPPPVATGDWLARSTAPGVVLAHPFISASELTSTDPNFGLQQAADGTIQGAIDLTGQLSPDTGWLMFKFRKGVGDKNIGGALSLYMNHAFKSGEKLYVQWRQKMDAAYLTNNLSSWHSSIKHVNIHGPSKTCQSAEVACISEPTTHGDFNRTLLYTNCGDGFNVNLPDGDILIQQGVSDTDGFNCHYQNQVPGTGNGVGCFFPQANVVYTFLLEVDCGDSTTVTGWVSDGGPYRQFQKGSHAGFFSDDKTLERIRLETYMTEISGAASVDAFVWYSQLIVSTQPIALPNG
jgi:hypothetical protein